MKIMIANGMIVDGSGAQAFEGDLLIEGEKIVGVLPADSTDQSNTLDSAAARDQFRREADLVINAAGCFVTPGLFDMHSHADVTMPAYPAMENYLVQGITTLNTGHCTMGLAPIDKWYATQCLEEPALKLLGKASTNGYDPGKPIVVKTEEIRPAINRKLGFTLDWTTYGEFLDHMRKEGVGCNFRGQVSFGMIRQQAMDGDCERSATPEEIQEMKRLLKRAMDGGAYGMDCGFDYMPDLYATPEEVGEVAKVLLDYDGVLEAHTQHSPSRYGKNWPEHTAQDGIRELLEIGKKIGVRVHISHLPNDVMGSATIDMEVSIRSAKNVLAMIEDYKKEGVRVTWDVIPPNCMSMLYYPQLAHFFAPLVIEEGGITPFVEKLRSDSAYEAWILECVEKKELDKIANIFPPFRRFLNDPEGQRTGEIEITRSCCGDIHGKTLGELAEKWQMPRAKVILEILKRDPQAFYHSSHVPSFTGGEETYLDSPDASVGFDSVAADFQYNIAEYDFPLDTCPPNNFNCMVKYLTETRLPFEQAIYKASGRCADILRISDRGRLLPGNFADVVIMDREKLEPCIDWAEPRTAPKGIEYVLVNGEFAVVAGKPTHNRNGRVL